MKYKDARHLIVDIETLGIKKPTPVLTIGAVIHDQKQLEVVAKKAFEIDLKSYEETPAEIELDTLLFWMKQNPTVQKVAFLGKNVRPIKEVLLNFVNFCNAAKPDFYWGNAPDFDLGHLEWWLDYYCIPVPWKYWQLRDIRTLCSEDLISELEREVINLFSTPHSALDDALREREFLRIAIDKLKGE